MTEIRPSEERESQSLQEGGGLAERIAGILEEIWRTAVL